MCFQEMLRTSNVVFETSGERSEQQALGIALESRLEQLQTLAATCLLMLHLEVKLFYFHHSLMIAQVRVHCFFYLLPVARQSSHVPSASQSQVYFPRSTYDANSMSRKRIHACSSCHNNSSSCIIYCISTYSNANSATSSKESRTLLPRFSFTVRFGQYTLVTGLLFHHVQAATTFNELTTTARSACTATSTLFNRR